MSIFPNISAANPLTILDVLGHDVHFPSVTTGSFSSSVDVDDERFRAEFHVGHDMITDVVVENDSENNALRIAFDFVDGGDFVHKFAHIYEVVGVDADGITAEVNERQNQLVVKCPILLIEQDDDHDSDNDAVEDSVAKPTISIKR